jgi:GT2 family glycosyltransferase
LMSRHTRDGRARLLPSGYYTTPARPTGIREAEALRLCGLAFRRKVFDDFMFDEALETYALKEDVDFSYRVSRHYRLLIAPGARFRHHKTPTARMSVRARSRMHVINNHRLFVKNLDGTLAQRVAFGWAMCGRAIYELARSVVKLEPGYFLGALEGIRQITRRPGKR